MKNVDDRDVGELTELDNSFVQEAKDYEAKRKKKAKEAKK